MIKSLSQPKKKADTSHRVQLPATIEPAPQPRFDPHTAHPHENLDRASRAMVASLTGGVSPHAFIEAWSDWALHIARAPGRQLELAERAQENFWKLMRLAALPKAGRMPAFTPKAYDHRFRHPGWQKAPFSGLQQGFLAVQDYWDYATDHLRGLRPEDADRTRFMARQMLDVMSPSNFPTLNPEIIEQTLNCKGKNLTEGARNFMHDFVNTVSQAHEGAPQGYQIGTRSSVCQPECFPENASFKPSRSIAS